MIREKQKSKPRFSPLPQAMSGAEPIRAALVELIELKDIAYRVENRAQFDIDKDRAREMERDYKKRRPLAWAAARAALNRSET